MRLAGEPDRLFTIRDMAAEFEISHNHLTKIVHNLARGGFVQTQRGKGGGFRLGKKAEEVSLGEIVRWLEPESVLAECFRKNGNACTLTPYCRFRGSLVAAENAFLAELDKTSLADCAISYQPVKSGRIRKDKK